MIEDNEPIAWNLQEIIENEGHTVAIAKDGRTGLNLAIALQPDLIFCDLKISGLDGFQLWQALRENPATCQLPVVFLTAWLNARTINRFQEMGVRWIAKPFGVPQIVAILRSC